MVGKTISHYKVLEKIGEGGMGEVYLAEDSRLNRKVALKILPEHLSDRAEPRERFEREARAVSSLNHPHICTLYDIGEQDGIHFLVMEHLVGETLEARLAKGALPLEQTLEYAIQIADALDKAHRQGVVHRDLKPGNIMLVKSGAKLLDFGLAKLQAADTPTNLSALPTEQANLTAEGTILGTLQYMAPEQLEAKEADSRTDIFAFGAVVYEMTTGKKAFEGKSQASLIAAIMQSDPRPMSDLQPMTPSVLDWVVKRCLAKEPDERVQTAYDVMKELQWVTEVGTAVDSLPAVTAPAAWKRAIPWGIAVVAVALVAGAIWSSTGPISRPITRFPITPEPNAALANVGGNELAVSPDGSSLVYLSLSGAGRQLYLRRRDEIAATPIPGTEGSFGQPFFSPDGESLAFFTIDQLKRVSLLGGGAMAVCNTVLGGVSGSWGPDDMIVFSDASYSLYRVSADGGEPRILASPDTERGEIYYRHPKILPGGEAVLFTVWGNGGFQTRVLSLETGDQKIVIDGGRQAHYLPMGYLVYEREGNLMTVSFDLERREISGDAVPVLEGIRQQNFAADYALSTNGTLVYVPGAGNQGSSLVWVDRDGTHQVVMESETELQQPRLSPDGKRVAFQRTGTGAPRRSVGDIWIYDLSRGTSTPLTFDASNTSPIWTLDGQQITFGRKPVSGPPVGVFSIPADGSGEAIQLTTTTTTDDTRYLPGSWSPDGVLAYSEGALGNQDIYVLTLQGKEIVEPFMVTEFDEKHPAFSPDGGLIAFISNRSGRDEVYVKPYPGEGGIMPISTGGGEQPLWARSGKELFYRSGQKMMVVSVETQPPFKAEPPRILFEGFYSDVWFDLTSNYDISPDGQRFIIVRQSGNENALTPIHVVLNWFEELKRRVPTDN